MNRPQRNEWGFTLVELLIVMAIISLVIVALGGALIAGVRNQAGVSERLNYSHNANLLATYVNADLASADGTATVEATPCSTASSKLQLSWAETLPRPNGTVTGRTSNYIATYAIADLSTVVGTPNLVLQRTIASSGLVGTSSVTSNVVHDLPNRQSVCASLSGGVITLSVTQGTGSGSYTFALSGKANAREVS